MRSAIAVTEEIDDLELAVEDLVAGIKSRIELGKNSAGMVFCDADVDTEELGARLHEALGFDILGMTTPAMMERKFGYLDIGITFCVLTGDDVEFAIASTGPLSKETYDEEIRKAYRAACGTASGDPRLILVGAPFLYDVTPDKYMHVLDDESKHVPVFGGVASDHYDMVKMKTFRNGDAASNTLQVLVLFGNVRPVFSVEHCVDSMPERRGVITEADGNRVLKIGNKTFKDYIAEMTSIPDIDKMLFYFQSTPFMMRMPDSDPEELSVLRDLMSMDRETGAGIFLSDMPVGSELSLHVMQRDSLMRSCETTVNRLFEKMRAQEGYDYSTVLVVSCNARHLLIGDVKSVEADKLYGMLGDHHDESVSSLGIYSYGEICPTMVYPDGTARNRFHNVSFATCAF